jgi:hypothetical protein
MNVGVCADQNDALDAKWSALCAACGKREEDPRSVMWRAYSMGNPSRKAVKNLRQVLVSISTFGQEFRREALSNSACG